MQAIETEIVEPSNAIALRDKSEAIAKSERKPMTAQELRIVEVNEALLPAYQKAATLELTDTEIEALMAPFPDEIVEVRPHDGLIYISHIHISNRLNKVLKPGKWALVCRRHWLEGNTMYGEYVLVIRGCYVGESVGGHPYQPNNPKVNYSDTLESTAAEALRRICGKRLSCGSQVWEPEYSRQWVSKYAKQVNGKWTKIGAPAPLKTTEPKFTTPTPAQTNKVPENPVSAPKNIVLEPKQATAEQRTKMISVIESEGPDAVQKALGYFIEAGAILPTESLKDVPLYWVPTTQGQMRELGLLIAKLNDTGAIERPSWVRNPNNPNPAASFNAEEGEENPFNEAVEDRPMNSGPSEQEPLPMDDEKWRVFPVPFGKNAGVPLAKLPKNTLFGFWANFTTEETFKGKPVPLDKLTRDKAFRAALDMAGIHYAFEKP